MGQEAGGLEGQMDLLADTTFLIDLWREQRVPGPATAFAKRSSGLSLGLPWVVIGEFLGGGVLAGHDENILCDFLHQYSVVYSNELMVRAYAKLFAMARQKRLAVGPNDLWIAACASVLDLPLITRNTADFRSVASIHIVAYGEEGS